MEHHFFLKLNRFDSSAGLMPWFHLQYNISTLFRRMGVTSCQSKFSPVFRRQSEVTVVLLG